MVEDGGLWASVWARLRLRRLPYTHPPNQPATLPYPNLWLYFYGSEDDVSVITVASDSYFKLYPSNFVKITF